MHDFLNDLCCCHQGKLTGIELARKFNWLPIPLEYLDLVVDPKTQTLRPNPAHGDKLMTEEY